MISPSSIPRAGEWQARSSAAFQDFCRFEFLVWEAVGVGDVLRIDDEGAVAAALHRSGADEVVDALGGGVGTQLGRAWGGVELSGGQWQKLALGRALMRPVPLVIVFDEPTASLDPVSEHVLFERFAAAARDPRNRGSVTLLVSHRFSTVRMADRIVVLRDGRVVETGTHTDLVARGGVYGELYSLQARSLTG
jgi:ATP-binding cassette subfamily B protein